MTTNGRIYTIPLRNTDKTLENEVINFETKVLRYDFDRASYSLKAEFL